MQGHSSRTSGVRHRRRDALILAFVVAWGIAQPVFSQSIPADAPPVRSPQDENGVDLATGTISVGASALLANPEIVIGSAEHGEMRFSRIQNGSTWRHAYTLALFNINTSSSTGAWLNLGVRSKFFTLSGGSYVPDERDGSTLVATGTNTYRYTSADGTIIDFGFPGVGWLASSLVKPTGEKWDFHYKSIPNGTIPAVRLQSVTSSLGYQLKLEYAASVPSATPGYFELTSTRLINNAVDYCDPTADTCTGLTQAWPTLSYASSTSGSTRTDTVTDSLGRATQFLLNTSTWRLTGVKRPSSSSNDVTIAYDGNQRVSSVAVPGRTTNYTWSLSENLLTGVATDSVGTVRTTVANSSSKVILSEIDGLNHTTSYSYDAYDRLEQITLPLGNKVKYTYDGRGNVTETRRIAIPGTALADLVSTAGYDADCTSPVKCNKPNWTKDANDNQTDYGYHPITGQLTSIILPQPQATSPHPRTTLNYSPLYAWRKNASGAVVQAPGPVYKLTSTSTCMTGATCAGSADERIAIVTYQAGSSSTPSNLLPTSQTVRSGDLVVSATTAFGFDGVGNLVTVDGPLAGSADTTAHRYDALRRSIGTIGPDPDGAGARPNAATRRSYDDKGRLIAIDEGTTAGQSDTAWSEFSAATRVAMTYDDADRILTESLWSGSAAYALTQYSYDARGRIDCAAQRMSPSVYTSLPASACVLSTEGSYGKDRIEKYIYNLANQRTQVQSAYGTVDIGTQRTQYNFNGLVAHVIDENNNRTSYTHDGHDRLSRTSYPALAKGSNAISASDYEQLTYGDGAGDNINVTSIRLRDGSTVALAYDKLNRLISRTTAGESVVTFGYNLLGQQTAVNRASDGVNVGYSYDALGRRISETQPYGSVAWQYDAAGRATRLTWGDGHYVVYDYDAAGQVTAIRENGATSGIGLLATYSYDDLGRRASVTYGNGTTRAYAWDAVSRLNGLKIDLAGTTGDQVIGGIGGDGGDIAYNPASQIVSLPKSNDAYVFGGHASASRNYAANGLNQYTAVGAFPLGYDARGNLTSSAGASYTYSKLNELKTAPGVAMTYDGTGRLIQYAVASTTRLYYAGESLVAEVDTSGAVLQRYVPGPGFDEPVVWYEGSGTASRRFLQADERGSIVAISNAAGNIVQINTYDEYGNPGATNIGRFQYTGQTWFAETGLYNFKARFYSPTLGRFLQTDPIGYGAGMNLYTYTQNDPINFVDPTGLIETILVPGSRCQLGDWWCSYSETNVRITPPRPGIGVLRLDALTLQAPSVCGPTPVKPDDEGGPITGARTHNEAETAWFLAQARHRNLGQIFMDHIPTGRLDLITHEHNTHKFIVSGFRYNSSQFGNFLAGYSGAYNYGVGGYWTARAAGVFLDVLEEGIYTDLDKKSIPFIEDGGAVGEMHRHNGCQ